jgi:hypothetical protein
MLSANERMQILVILPVATMVELKSFGKKVSKRLGSEQKNAYI